jgi:hypothetical protein
LRLKRVSAVDTETAFILREIFLRSVRREYWEQVPTLSLFYYCPYSGRVQRERCAVLCCAVLYYGLTYPVHLPTCLPPARQSGEPAGAHEPGARRGTGPHALDRGGSRPRQPRTRSGGFRRAQGALAPGRGAHGTRLPAPRQVRLLSLLHLSVACHYSFAYAAALCVLLLLRLDRCGCVGQWLGSACLGKDFLQAFRMDKVHTLLVPPCDCFYSHRSPSAWTRPTLFLLLHFMFPLLPLL